VDPIVVEGAISFTPSPITVVSSGVDPFVIPFGSLTFTPSPITVVSDGVDPTLFFGSTTATPSPITVVTSGFGPNVFARFPGTPGFIGFFWQPLVPDPITGVTLNEVGDSVEITWDVIQAVIQSGLSTEYEVWSSVGDQNNYNHIATVNNIEISSGLESVTVVDETYDAISTIYYKLYHISTGYYSNPLESGIALTYSVPDPTNLTYEEGYADFSLMLTPPTSRLWSHVEIYKDAQVIEGNLSEGAAVLVYSGKTSSFIYEIPGDDRDKYHQFWISSVTKT
jgi:hypothetical protein